MPAGRAGQVPLPVGGPGVVGAAAFGNRDAFFFALDGLGLASLRWMIRRRPRFGR